MGRLVAVCDQQDSLFTRLGQIPNEGHDIGPLMRIDIASRFIRADVPEP